MKYLKIKAIHYGLLVLLWVGACASPSSKKDEINTIDLSHYRLEPEARGMLTSAEKAFIGKKFEEAKKQFQFVRQKFPKGNAAMIASFRLGVIHYIQKDFHLAQKEFEHFLSRYPRSELVLNVQYHLASSLYQERQYEKAMKVLKQISSNPSGSGLIRSQLIYELMKDINVELGDYASAAKSIDQLLKLPQDDQKRLELIKEGESYINRIQSELELEDCQKQVSDPILKSNAQLRLVALRKSFEEIPKTLSPTEVPSKSGLETSETTDHHPEKVTLDRGSVGEVSHIGVILPLSGKFAAFGKRALEGILLASETLASDKNSTRTLSFFIEDSASNPILARQAVDRLVKEHRVMAIIGPLNLKESLATAERANQIGVLNFSLAAKEGITQKGPYLFQNALTPKVQLSNLVRFCVEQKKFKRFAIVAPDNAYGLDMANQFWDLVEALGGKIVADHRYDPSEKDLQAHLRELVGLNPKWRPLEWNKIQQLIQDQKDRRKKDPKLRLSPIVDFDAIFLPDSPKQAALVALGLNYLDVFSVPLIGTVEWNTDQLYKRGGRSVEGAIFPSNFNSQSRNKLQQEFFRFYLQNVGVPPDLVSTQAYEATLMLISALEKNSGNRAELVQRLSAFKSFQGPIGEISLDADRVVQRRIPTLELDSSGRVREYP